LGPFPSDCAFPSHLKKRQKNAAMIGQVPSADFRSFPPWLFPCLSIFLPGGLRKPLSRSKANVLAMRFTTLKLNSLRDLFIEELRDLYSAETQLVDALPKMAEAAASQELASAFEHHLEETRGHVSRLESIFNQIGEKSSGETCEAMKGLIKEGEILVKAEGDPDVRDAGLIGAAQRVEHYEMAGYGTARSLARRLGENQTAEILQQTLDEEGEANKKLTSIAESQVNVVATSRA
jgi:ferritin-like metal-binding protein YciE